MPDPSRRDLLKLARNVLLSLSGALALGGLFRFLDFDPKPAPRTEFDLGPADDYPLNSRTPLSDPPAMLLHTDQGFSAFSLICTHLGCTVEQDDGGFACPCHGSRFDVDGRAIHGPAVKSLRPLRVETTSTGNLHLYLV